MVQIAEPLIGIEAVLAFVRNYTTDRTVVAIDAPLIIANSHSQRECETLVSRRYGSRDASCHTSNLSLYPDAASVRLANELARDGFHHAPVSGDDRVMLEVYPHAALVELFALEKIIKYKKGTVEGKRTGLKLLQDRVSEFSRADPPLLPGPAFQSFIAAGLLNLSGQRLKNYEDALDALICAYLACYYWRWNLARNEIFGNVEKGYIVNPSLPLALTHPE